jgi:hypothetical protein
MPNIREIDGRTGNMRDLGNRLTALIVLEREMREFDDKIPPEEVAKLIDLLSRRMHKRYKR